MAVMVVGIGFVAVITAAIAQRFVDVAVHEEIEEAEEALAATDAEVLREIRAIGRGWKPSRRHASTWPRVAPSAAG